YAADRADQRRHHRPAAADDLHAARPRGDEHYHRPALVHAGRAALRPGAGGTVDGPDQWRRTRPRGHLEIYRGHSGDDGIGRADADSAPDRADACLEGEALDRLPGLSQAYGL